MNNLSLNANRLLPLKLRYFKNMYFVLFSYLKNNKNCIYFYSINSFKGVEDYIRLESYINILDFNSYKSLYRSSFVPISIKTQSL